MPQTLKPRTSKLQVRALTCLIIQKKNLMVEKKNSEITFQSIPEERGFIFYKLSLWPTVFVSFDFVLCF